MPQRHFANTNWDFLFVLMEQLKMGWNFINVIKAIYKNQMAAIRTNNNLI